MNIEFVEPASIGIDDTIEYNRNTWIIFFAISVLLY